MSQPISIHHKFSQLFMEFEQSRQQTNEKIKSITLETETISQLQSPRADALEVRSFQLSLEAEQLKVDDLQRLSKLANRFIKSVDQDVLNRQRALTNGYEALSHGKHLSFQYNSALEKALSERDSPVIPERQSSPESGEEELSSSQLAADDLEQIFKPNSPILRPKGPSPESQEATDNAFFAVETKVE